VLQNKNVETFGNTSIKDFNFEIKGMRMYLTLEFYSLKDVSLGGVKNPDLLNLTLIDPNMFVF
jgi:hypothetical protein